MPIPYKSRPRPEPRISTCSALLRQREAGGRLRTLCIDIGGTGIKMIVLDPEGQPVNERARELTPKPATPEAMLEVMRGMLPKQPRFDRVSVGKMLAGESAWSTNAERLFGLVMLDLWRREYRVEL